MSHSSCFTDCFSTAPPRSHRRMVYRGTWCSLLVLIAAIGVNAGPPDECSSGPCLNGATCAAGGGVYTCTCVPGFSGLQCQTNINECASTPCKNGGTCLDSTNGYSCTCVAGWSGTNCQTDINECASSPCANGGTCFDALNSFSCRCQPGFNATLKCQQPSDWCSELLPCLHGGVCTNPIIASGGAPDYHCDCTSTGFAGSNCQYQEGCTVHPCQNGATCISVHAQCRTWATVTQPASPGVGATTGVTATAGDVMMFFPQTLTTGFFYPQVSLFFISTTHMTYAFLMPSKFSLGAGGLADIIMVASGSSVTGPRLTTVELLNTTSMTWDPSPGSLSLARSSAAIVGYNQTFYVIGGFTASSTSTGVIDTYNIITRVWSTITSLSTARANPQPSIPGDGFLYVFGGLLTGGANTAVLERYSFATGSYLTPLTGSSVPAIGNLLGGPIQPTGDKLLFAGSQNTAGSILNAFNLTDQTFYTLEVSPPLTSGTTFTVIGQGYMHNRTVLYQAPATRASPVLSYEISTGTIVPLVNPIRNIEITSVVSSAKGVMVASSLANFISLLNVYSDCATTDSQVESYNCSCLPAYRGTNCTIEIVHCASNPCANGGTCVENGDSCICPTGWGGEFCNINIDDCASLPCQNGATCIDGFNSWTCSCAAGFTGLICQTNINECVSAPCQNGATCSDAVNGYNCRCDFGFNGTNCEKGSDWCGATPRKCFNGGLCSNVVIASGASTDYACNCAGTGFYGPNCQYTGSCITSHPCLTNEICTDIPPTCQPTWSALNITSTNPLATGRDASPSGVAGNIMLFIGSTAQLGHPLRTTVDLFVISSYHYLDSDLSTRRQVIGVYGMGDTIMCAGGTTVGGGLVALTDVDLLNTTSMTWSTTALSVARAGPSVVGWNDTFYVAGGRIGTGGTVVTNVVETYNRLTKVWSTIAPFNAPRSNLQTAAVDGVLYLYGGRLAGNVISVQLSRYTILNSSYATELFAISQFASTFPFTLQPTGDKLLFEGATAAGFTTYNVFNLTDQRFYLLAVSPSTTNQNSIPVGQGYMHNFTILYGSATNRASPVLAYDIASNSIRTLPDPPVAIRLTDVACSSNGVMATVHSLMTQGLANNVYTECLNSSLTQTPSYTCRFSQCFSNPCRNGATCVDSVTAYSCTCPAGFSGPVCQTDINECASGPCQNGATCLDATNGFTCTCVDGYTGVLCAHITACVSLPCQNGGTCAESGVGTFNCTCVDGYTGNACQTTVDECASNPCQNGATCNPSLGAYSCACADGYSGDRCQTDTNECASAPCMNGGTCVDGINSWTCICPGIMGTYCERSPCGNWTLSSNGFQLIWVLTVPGPVASPITSIPFPQPLLPSFTGGDFCSGLAWNIDATRLYTLCIIGPTATLVQVDPVTGAGTAVGPSDQSTCLAPAGPDPPGSEGIALHPLTGLLYVLGVYADTATECLASLNLTTGISTDVGTVGGISRGGTIWFDSLGNLFHTQDEGLDTISTVDATPILGYPNFAFPGLRDCEPCDSGGCTPRNINIVSPAYNGLFFGIVQCRGAGQWFLGTFDLSFAAPAFLWQVQTGPSAGLDYRTLVNICSPNGPCQGDGPCVCSAGYTGFLCDTPIDLCASFPCANGGTCTGTFPSYNCTCAAGYVGTNCETDVNECGSSPCQNGATCVDLPNGYQCDCAAGFEGDQCQTDLNECASNPCLNGATCVDGMNSYTCHCGIGYTGLTCQTNIDECASNPCRFNSPDMLSSGIVLPAQQYQSQIAFDNGGLFIGQSVSMCQTGLMMTLVGSHSVAVYRLPGLGLAWELVTVIRSDNCASVVEAHFSGNCSTIVMGCQGENSGIGQAVVQDYIAGQWVETAVLVLPTIICPTPGSCQAGASLDISPDRTVIMMGAPSSNHTIGGVGYWQANDTIQYSWAFMYMLQGSGNVGNSFQGGVVRMHRAVPSTYVVWSGTSDGGSNGAVWIFHLVSAKTWVQLGTKIVSGVSGPINFGKSITFDGSVTLLSIGVVNRAAVQIFRRSGSTVTFSQSIGTPADYAGSLVSSSFGASAWMSVNSQLLVVGDFFDNSETGAFWTLTLNSTGQYNVNGTKYVPVPVDTHSATAYLLGIDGAGNGQTLVVTVQGTGTSVSGFGGAFVYTAIDVLGFHCIDGIGSYTCRCPPGYSGANCQTDINECASNPCQNAGTCTDAVNFYTCTCLTGYTGTQCQTNINECASNPCGAGSTCVDGTNRYTCICAAGQFGTANCTNCTSGSYTNSSGAGICLPCNPGTDQPLFGQTSCTNCTAGTFQDQTGGTSCPACPVNTFQPSTGQIACIPCPSGTNGTNCVNNLNTCASSPCMNGGSCTNSVNAFTCQCTAGYSGSNCQTNINECGSAPCQNGATCIDRVGSYSCNCTVGFSGTFCQIQSDPCSSNPCSGPATCVSGGGVSHTCICAAGYVPLANHTDTCGPCDRGQFGVFNQSTCLGCLPGVYQNLTGQSFCFNCSVNTFNPFFEAFGCTQCPNGTYQPSVGGTSCIPCPPHFRGVNCDVLINDCATNNGGCDPLQNCTLILPNGGHTCGPCPDGYIGTTNCTRDFCVPDLCQNGATCHSGAAGFTCECPPTASGVLCENTGLCAFKACPATANCTVIDQLGIAICVCPTGFQGDNCDQSEFVPDGPISGQGGWGRGTYNASYPDVSGIVEEIRIPEPNFVLEGVASWFVSNVNATLGSFVFSPAFLKTDGDPSIVRFLSRGQFYGGNTFDSLTHVHAASLTADGTRMTISIGSDINLNSSATVAIDYRLDTGLTLTVVSDTNQTAITGLDPSVFHAIYMKVHTYPGPGNDVLLVELDGVSIYRGTSLESRYPQAQPMNNMRFGLGLLASEIGFPITSPNGAYVDVYFERVYNATDADDFYGTSFENGLCSNTSAPCVVNGGTCVAANNFTVCIDCPTGRSGSVCQDVLGPSSSSSSTAGVSNESSSSSSSSAGQEEQASTIFSTAAIILIAFSATALVVFAGMCIGTSLMNTARPASVALTNGNRRRRRVAPAPPEKRERRSLIRTDSGSSLELSDIDAP